MYKALIDYFFETEIDFRCVLIKYKDKLEHHKFNNGSHDTFYYKMVFFLLKSATNPPTNEYKVYLDIKDTRGKEKLHIIKIENKYYKNPDSWSGNATLGNANERINLLPVPLLFE